jgi:5-formyltetrahydrofolate cyclo-ligase
MKTDEAKRRLRREMRRIRDAEVGRPEQAKKIFENLFGMPGIQQAQIICCYVSFRSEVDTHEIIRCLLANDKSVVVPWCKGMELRLARIKTMNELAPRTLGLLEPNSEIRNTPAREVRPDQIQTFLVPGLAFTTSGDRLGYGRGYYDRLLSAARESFKVALCFDCQIVESLPVAEHDVPMDVVVSGSRVFS